MVVKDIDDENTVGTISDDEEESENIIFTKKKKRINKSFEEDEDKCETENQETFEKKLETDISNNDSGIEENQNENKANDDLDTSESDSDVENERTKNSVTKKKKYCFDDHSDSSSDEYDSLDKTNSSVIDNEIENKEKSTRETSTKKDKKKALEELIERKKYKTRGEEKKEEFEANATEHLFTNKDLFCVDDSSDSDESEDEKNDEINEDEDEEKTKTTKSAKKSGRKKENKEKIKKPTKASIKETKSEQQRLCRERVVNIPYHEPEVASLKSFLNRIPKIKSKSNSIQLGEENEKEEENDQTSKNFQNIFKEKPRLSLQTMEFVENENSESEKEISEVRSENKVLDSFMKRFAKHTLPTKKSKAQEENSLTTHESPGLAHQILKNQLKQQISEERRKSAIETEKQAKFYDHEDFSEEEKFNDDEEADNESSDDNDGDVDKNDADDDDEEIEKWNAEDERRQIEVQLEEDMNIDEDDDADADNKNNDADAEEQQEDNEETSQGAVTSLPASSHAPADTQWSNSSSVLQAGQGNACNPCTVVIGSTPFTKLLKSGLLDSVSKNNIDAVNKEEASCIEMPIEDTQDLYRDDVTSKKGDENDDDNKPEKFHFQLDEDTQFVPLLDSQGNFQDPKEQRKSISKSLFDAKLQVEESQPSLTQVLGFCSGSFGNTGEAGKASPKPDKESKLTNFFDFGDGVDDAVNFCSGKFSDFKTQQKDNDVTSESQSGKENSKAIETEGTNETEEIDFTKTSENDGQQNPIESESVNESSLNGSDKAAKSEVKECLGNNDDGDQSDGSGNVGNDAGESENEGADEESDDDVENEDDIVDGEESNQNVPEELQEWTEFLSGKKKVKRLNKRAFYEEEAELSGSDVNSDDEEYGSEYDEYEIDSGAEEGLPDDEKLRRQVHKIHQRKLLDQDKREVRILQELYLEDGELGGGAARKRNFRWRNIDEDMGGNENKRLSDEENDDPILTMSIDQRLERIEKEKFLQESQSTGNEFALDEDSQLILEKIQAQDKPVSKTSQLKSRGKCPPIKRSGSLLGKATALSAPGSGIKQPNAQKTGKSFVFQAAEDLATPKTRKKVTRDESKSMTCQPARKKQRIERKNSLPISSSIFNLL